MITDSDFIGDQVNELNSGIQTLARKKQNSVQKKSDYLCVLCFRSRIWSSAVNLFYKK